jgi:hypothetical protein
MGTFREELLANVVNPLRYLPDTTFDLRTFVVTLIRREWQPLGSNPAQVDVGEFDDVPTVLEPRPKVREQGGVSSNGWFLVDKITPSNTAGGYTPEQLNPPAEDGVEFFWKLEGPFASGLTEQEFEVVSINTSKPFTYSVMLQPRERRKVT